MDKKPLMEMLLNSPDRSRIAEEQRDNKAYELLQAEHDLMNAEHYYLLMEDGPINGKNETIRSAQLAERTAPERIRVEELEHQLTVLDREVRYQARMFDALLAASRIIAPEA